MTAASKNHIRGYAPLRGFSPVQEAAGEEWRDTLLTRVEEHLAALKRTGRQSEWEEAMQVVKLFRLKSKAGWWTSRRLATAEVLMAELGGSK